MSKHSTTHRTLSRRLAALLAVLALLAAMALPVYAEALDGATGTAQAEIGDTISDGTVTTENDSTTPEPEQSAGPEQPAPTETPEPTAEPTLTPEPAATATATPVPTVTPTDAKKNAAAKTNTEQDNLFDAGDDPDEEDTMLAGDSPDSDDANAPDTIANTSESTGFIPATTTIYFEDDGRYDSKYGGSGNCTIRFLAQNINAEVIKDMTLTEKENNGHKVFSVTLNSADYPAGGFYRLAFQYYVNNNVNNNKDWKEEIYAFGGRDTGTKVYWTAIDQLAGKKFVRTGNQLKDDGDNHYNLDLLYSPDQWKRVEYYYKGMPLYFKNASDTALEGVTAVFYKQDETSGTVETDRQIIGTVGANKFYAQKILIPNNQSRFVKFTWDGGESALYDFTTDYTEDSATGAQKLDLTTANCYVYNNGTADSWASAGADLLTKGKTIYFDATLSEYSYKGEGTEIERAAMPGANGTLYCLLTGPDGAVKSLMMTPTPETAPDTPTDPAPDTPAKRKLWSCKIPEGTYTAVQFCTTDKPDAPAYNKTKQYSTAQIPPTLQEPCFFADDGDPTAYSNESRDGYWGEKDSIRDAESGKNNPVVDIASNETFTQESGTKYITSTLYDYYTDYELNGFNRDDYPYGDTSSQRGYVTFEQFNRALSSAYEANGNVLYPLYTGHFQPSVNNWPNPFSNVAKDMGLLYGWGEVNSPDYKKFMAVNNSVLDINGKEGENGQNNYDKTFQGLVEDKTSDSTKDGLPLLKRKDEQNGTALPDPHFNKDFLQGKNAFNTVLGKVYENVSFPLKKKAVFAKDPEHPSATDAKYWYFDSNETSLYLKQDSALQSYYLAGKGTNNASLNRDAGNGTNGPPDKKFGFFPFNQTVTGSAPQYNYGFGAKLQFDFTLTEDGKLVVGKDDKGNVIEVPIQFFFSGDDDVWVYIDGELVLDVGGAHDRAAGLLEFGSDGQGKNTVTSWVSDAKAGGRVYKPLEQNSQKTVTFNKKDYIFRYKTENGTEKPKTLQDKPTHTLTMYYMERGMWESNMALAFNFPDHNELQVEKKVDVSDVNPLFQASFLNQKIFTFNIQNLATHYGTAPAYTPKIDTYKLPDNVYSSATGLLRYESSLPKEVDKDQGSAVLWESDKADPTSEHRADRRGTLTLDGVQDISQYSYLTFDVYVVGDQSETCALSNLYVELWDDTGSKQMGCLGTKGLQSSDVYGAATALHPGQWYTVRMMLNSLELAKGFDKTKLKSITVGDNYARSIYLRNFTFSSAPTLPPQTGFTTAQYNIPDYGSAETGELKNAAYAVFSSNLGNGDVVDENGDFLLQAGETATFNDQFRRGSYIALKEEIDTDLYEPSWTVYENGVPVTSVGGNDDFVTGKVDTLQNVGTTAPDDGRTEKVVAEPQDGHVTLNKYETAQKPKNANTLVFRSYSDNAAEDELTKLKVVFNNKVKTGKLVIRKVLVGGEGETLENQEFTFTVRFGDVGGQSLGGTNLEKEYICKVRQHDDGCYGEIEIDKIPVGTRFVVSEKPQKGTSLQKVTIEGIADGAVSDGMAYGTIAEGDEKAAKATFVNTTRKLIDITVKKEWKKQDGETDIPQADLPNAIYLQLQRTETPEKPDSWQTVKIVELKKPTDYNGWTTQFTGLDKYGASKTGTDQTPYTYRVLESATGEGDWHGGAADDVIRIDGKKYEVLNTTVTGGSDDKTLTLTNKLQDPRFNLKVIKADAEKTNIKLKDVEFKLEKLKATDNNLVVDDTFPAITGTTDANGNLLVTKDGKSVEGFTELEAGIYQLTEIKAADEYNLLSGPIQIEFTKDHECKLNSVNANSDIFKPNLDGSYTLTLTVLNRKTPALPHTGADAPSLWLLIGLPLAVAGLLILVFRYNKKGGRTR